MIISFRLSDEDNVVVRKCAETKGMSLSEFIRKSVMEKIESGVDFRLYEESVRECENKPAV